MRWSLLVALAVVCGSADAQGLRDATKTFTAGNWSVLRSIDRLTDKVQCTGVFRDNFKIQLADTEIFVRVPALLEGVTMRFGDLPADALRLASDTERRMSTVILSEYDLNRALETGRVRLQAALRPRGSHFEDIDMTGAAEAIQHIKQGCPLPPGGATAVAAPQPSLCSAALRQRLADAGVRPEQIAAACDQAAR